MLQEQFCYRQAQSCHRRHKHKRAFSKPQVGACHHVLDQVLTAGLNQVDVFFQGAKVRQTNPNTKTVILEAAELVASPVDRTDSQLR